MTTPNVVVDDHTKGTVHLHVNGSESEPAGKDMALTVLVPESWYMAGDALLVQVAARCLEKLSGEVAGKLGETLHHADWHITRDYPALKVLADEHDCADCRQGAAFVAQFMLMNPDRDVAYGRLHWVAKSVAKS